MQWIADWLDHLGLERYTRCFAENDIDFSVLCDLNDADLEKIGVASLGHRRKLLRAIAEISKSEKGVAPAVNLAVGAGAVARPPDFAERRQVTVMFSDLVGSTALSARIDPEDLREVISAYQTCVAKTVERFNGFVAKYMGDGVLVYFGYPEAHEDDAEQAVRAGLELVAAVTALRTSVSLQTRVGIATGLVVVGDLIGSGEAQERGIIGETPNLAARLQGVAEPNMVVIADSTRRLLGDLFELEDLGPQDLKGIVGPARAWAALRQSAVESRFEAMHATGLTALVGRDEECELLLRRWSRAKARDGQAVLLSGEAGIGKSRLTAALLERLGGEPHTRLRYFCSPQHADSALYPIIGHMERAAGFRHEDAPQVKRDKLDALLAQTATSGADIALFADMLSLPNDGRHPALGLTPQQQRQKTLQALVSQIEALTRQTPVLMIFEDAHWTDPTSLEVLDLVVERIQTLPVLLIVTFRPEFEPPWIGRPYVTFLAINRLAQREIDSLIDRVVGDRMLPASIRHDIIERADGIPLFVEEMTKAVLEAESEGEARRTAAVIPSPTVAVPASLHASLMARLDRLGVAKEVAQIGAAIGREFSHALLTAVTGKPDADLASALDCLIAAGLLFRQGVPPHATYLFKHALVQDAAYGTLLREPRRALHVRIAEALGSHFADLVTRQPQLLAHHCTEAGLVEKAAQLWGEAGQRSLARSALVEGAAQLTRALRQLDTLPTTPALRREQIKFQVALANVLMHTKGYAAPETMASLDRARLYIERAEALGEPPEDRLLLFSVRYGFWVAKYVGFNGDVCCELARQFLALAEKQNAEVPRMIGHRLMGSSLLLSGEVAQAKLHYDETIALYNPAQHRPLAMRFGQDVGVATLSFRSLALWVLGYPESALADTEHALRDARAIDQAATLMYALSHVPLTLIHRGDYAAASTLADEGIGLADEKGALLWNAAGTIFKGYISLLTGNAWDAAQMLTSGMSATRWTGSTLWMPLNLSHLALANAALGQLEDASRFIDEAMNVAVTTRSRWYEAEIHRIAGEIALMLPARDAAKAEAYYERALAIARQQQAKSWELRAATSMARLWRGLGKPQQAYDLLAPIYGWFTEGFDTLDLKRAKALLAELEECVSAI